MTDQIATQNGKLPSVETRVDSYDQANNDNRATIAATADTQISPPIIATVYDAVGSQQGTVRAGSTTDDSRPRMLGKGQPNSTVTIYDNGNVVGTATVDARGIWTFTPGTALSDGPHSLTAMVDGQPSAPFAFNVNTQAPPPIIATVYDAVGSQQGTVREGSTTDDSRPHLLGKAQPNSTVTIYDNGNVIGTASVDARGIWRFAPDAALNDGPHSLTAVVDGQASAPFTFNVNTQAPPPIIGNVSDVAGDQQGYVHEGMTTDDNHPNLMGKAQPNSTVTIYDNGNMAGTALVDARGLWKFTPEAALSDGPHSLIVVAEDGTSSAPFNFNVQTAPVSELSAKIDYAIDDLDGSGSELHSGDITKDRTPTLHGTGEPNTMVHIWDNQQIVASVVVGKDGHWSYEPSADLLGSSHAFRVQGAHGSLSEVFEITIDPRAFPPVTIERGEESDGSGLASGETTSDEHPTLIGKVDMASPWVTDQAGNIWVIILDNGQEIGRVQPDGRGYWEYQFDTALSQTEHHFTAKVGDSPASNTFDLIEVPPVSVDAPTIDSFDIGGSQLPSDSTTDFVRGVLRGQGDGTHSTVDIYMDGQRIGTAKVGVDGSWLFRLGASMPDGPHEFTVRSDDGPESTLFEINVVTAPPAINSLYDSVDDHNYDHGGVVIDDTTPDISGTGAKGGFVLIYDNGKLIGKAIVNESTGTWSFTPGALGGTHELEPGPHHLTVQADNGKWSDGSFDFDIPTDGGTDPVPESDLHIWNYGVTPHDIELHDGDVSSKTQLNFSGNTKANGWVAIMDGDHEVARVQAEQDGSWTWYEPGNFVEGPHSFSVLPDGGVASAPIHITIDVPLTILSVQDHEQSGEDEAGFINYMFGSAHPGSLVTITDGITELGTAQAGEDGRWFLSFGQEGILLTPPGLHHLVATLDGGAETASFDINIGTTPPVTEPTPVILGATVDDAFHGNGEWIEHVRPTLKGKNAGANAIVTIMDDGHPIGTVQASAYGNWSFPMENAVSDGMHHYTAQVGNGPISKPFDLGVVTPTPSIDVVYDHAGGDFYYHGGIAIGDEHPTFTGKGPLGGYVTLLDDGHPIGTVPVDANGFWSFTPELGLGPHHFTVTSDNGKASAGSFDVTVDSSATTHDASDTLSLNDVVAGIEGELFATDHSQDHDDAQLSVHDVAEADSTTMHDMSVTTHDAASINTNLVLPHEQVHAVM